MIARQFGILLVAAALTASASASAQELKRPVTLVPHVIVDDEVIRLGDLFHNIGERADIAVAYAPRWGSRIVFDSNWLSRAARIYKLRWRARSRFDKSVVERASQKIDVEAIKSAVLDALSRRGVEGKLRVAIDNFAVPMHLPVTAEPSVSVTNLKINRRDGRFSATVAAPADRPLATRTVHGRYDPVIEVPVLARRLNRREVIGEDDVEWKEIAVDRVQRNVLTAADDLIGMSPRRFLRAGVPLRASDLRRPIVVPKGAAVTMTVRTPLMTITARGKAIESGSMGDVIRVMNIQSKKIIDAEVVDGGTVVVKRVGAVAQRR